MELNSYDSFDLEAMKDLVNDGADTRWIISSDGATHLHKAVDYRNVEMVCFLLENEASANAATISGETVLYKCLYGNQKASEEVLKVVCKIIEILLSYGADPCDEKCLEYVQKNFEKKSSIYKLFSKYFK
jgi:ankyrin repeat protein